MKDNNIQFEDNPLFPETTLFLGNGFDLSLGLQTKYTDFFNHVNQYGNKDFWPNKNPVMVGDHLYMRLNGLCQEFGQSPKSNSGTYKWNDLEDELKKHAKRKSHQGIQNVTEYQSSFEPDLKYFEDIKRGLMNYLKFEVDEWSENRHIRAKSSAAYNLMYEVCVQANAVPNIITFNYTDISYLMSKCEGNLTRRIDIREDKVQHVHGSLLDEHIILGIDEDREVPKEYDFLFKSWDDYYGSHKVIDTLKSSQIIIFFGLSFGSIDSVYFVDFFKSIIKGTYDNRKKHILICTFDESSMRAIYRQFFEMGISIMELKAHCDFRFMLTNPTNISHPHKFDKEEIGRWLHDCNDITLDL